MFPTIVAGTQGSTSSSASASPRPRHGCMRWSIRRSAPRYAAVPAKPCCPPNVGNVCFTSTVETRKLPVSCHFEVPLKKQTGTRKTKQNQANLLPHGPSPTQVGVFVFTECTHNSFVWIAGAAERESACQAACGARPRDRQEGVGAARGRLAKTSPSRKMPPETGCTRVKAHTQAAVGRARPVSFFFFFSTRRTRGAQAAVRNFSLC